MCVAGVLLLNGCSGRKSKFADGSTGLPDGGSCSHQCETPGTTCAGNVLKTCTKDGSGCLVADEITCPKGCDPVTSACVGCAAECGTVGEAVCQAGVLKRCEVNSDGCRVWGDPVACPNNLCASATACAACEHECPAAGPATCVGDELHACVEDAAGCRKLSTQKCPFGCSDGACAACQPTGFSGTGKSWSLPGGFSAEQLDDVAMDSSFGCADANEQLSYATMDLTGDGLPDLVVADQCDAAGAGTTHWLVFANTGSGFSGTGASWSLPAGFSAEQLDDVAMDSSFGCADANEQLSYATMDLTGDGLPDLVVADQCDAAGVGTTHWLVFVATCK